VRRAAIVDGLMLTLVAAAAACDDGAADGPPETPPAVESVVALEKRGDGLATVTTDPAGLACDVFCTDAEATFTDVEAVDVLVEPSRDAQFVRAFCLATGEETVRADVLDDTGRARLSLPQQRDGVAIDWRCVVEHRQVNTLQVVVETGTGSGRVLGALAASLEDESIKRIDCPGDCVGGYFVDEVETLTATADDGSVFVRWNFCSESTDPILTVAMTRDENCEAIFDLAP
jgi:hypothetical protein